MQASRLGRCWLKVTGDATRSHLSSDGRAAGNSPVRQVTGQANLMVWKSFFVLQGLGGWTSGESSRTPLPSPTMPTICDSSLTKPVQRTGKNETSGASARRPVASAHVRHRPDVEEINPNRPKHVRTSRGNLCTLVVVGSDCAIILKGTLCRS